MAGKVLADDSLEGCSIPLLVYQSDAANLGVVVVAEDAAYGFLVSSDPAFEGVVQFCSAGVVGLWIVGDGVLVPWVLDNHEK